jgi:polysaccharide biosynthesis/export protein
MIRAAAVLILALLVAACAGPIAVSPPDDRLASKVDLSQGYRLGVGDKLRLTVYDEPSLSGEFTVGASGAISVPLIGEVPTGNRTATDVAADIRAKLADGYLRDPRVSAEVITYRPFYILGEVKAPGNYPYVVGLTALNAIATAEGFTPRAEQSRVFIRRFGEEQEKAYELVPDLLIFPGDTIRLGERYF